MIFFLHFFQHFSFSQTFMTFPFPFLTTAVFAASQSFIILTRIRTVTLGVSDLAHFALLGHNSLCCRCCAVDGTAFPFCVLYHYIVSCIFPVCTFTFAILAIAITPTVVLWRQHSGPGHKPIDYCREEPHAHARQPHGKIIQVLVVILPPQPRSKERSNLTSTNTCHVNSTHQQ